MAQLYLNEKLVKQGNVGTSGLEMESNEVRLGALDNNVEAFTGAVSCLQIFDESLNVQQIGVLKTACQPGMVNYRDTICLSTQNKFQKVQTFL